MKIWSYEEPDGSKPVNEQLEDLRVERPDEYEAVFKAKRMVSDLTYEKAREGEYVKNVRDKIDALKIWGKQSRILGWREGSDFIAAHHVIKKQHGYRDEDIQIAQARRESYYDRRD